MGKRMLFLLTVFVVLVASIAAIAWISKVYIFGQLEPAFVGALVGAAGTIFAACIAYTAASDNLQIARDASALAERQRLEGERNQKRFAREQANREIQALRELQAFMDRLLAAFAGATDGIGDHDFFAKMMDADRNGTIVGYMGNAPDPFRVRTADLIQRLFGIKNTTIQANAMAQNPQRPTAETNEDRNRLNASIRDRIVERRPRPSMWSQERPARAGGTRSS
jgi:hypothetical protein